MGIRSGASKDDMSLPLFSDDILKVEISGPKVCGLRTVCTRMLIRSHGRIPISQSLTCLDFLKSPMQVCWVPLLVIVGHTLTREGVTTELDKAQVRNMVQRYMENERTM